MRPNLVEHASEIDKATDFCRWAANAQLVHRLSINDSPGRLHVAIAPTDLLPARTSDRKAHDPVLVDCVEKPRSSFPHLRSVGVCEGKHTVAQIEGVATIRR